MIYYICVVKEDNVEHERESLYIDYQAIRRYRVKKLKITIVVLVTLAVIAIAILNIFPIVENWLHDVTGWN